MSTESTQSNISQSNTPSNMEYTRSLQQQKTICRKKFNKMCNK